MGRTDLWLGNILGHASPTLLVTAVCTARLQVSEDAVSRGAEVSMSLLVEIANHSCELHPWSDHVRVKLISQ